MPIQTWKGPWGGMDMREGEAAPNSYFLGCNIDTSAGQIAARPPLGVIGTGLPSRARLHLIDRPGLDRVILALGQASTTLGADITFRVFDIDGNAIGSAQNLTTAFGEVARDEVLCSFVDTFLRPTDTGISRPAVLVTTDQASYVYEPTVDAANLRRVAVSTDAQRVNTSNLYYVDQSMPGPITEVHQTRVYYAGFRSGYRLYLNGTLATVANGQASSPPEAYIGAGRAYLTSAPHVLMWSDENDPCGVPSVNFAMVDPGERITGLHSTGSALLILTDKGIWALTGSTIADFAIQKLTHGVGCVAHESVVTVGGVVYFAGRDGIYAFGGMGAPEAVKLSPQLDPLWEGGEQIATHLPEVVKYLTGYGFPWVAQQAQLPRMVGRHYARPNQIWWSLPVSGPWNATAHGLTLVYDVQGNAWNVYFCSPISRYGGGGLVQSGQSFAGPMVDAVQVDGRWLTANAFGDLQELGRGRVDGLLTESNTTAAGVPAYWCSRRFPDSGDDQLQVTDVRFKIKSEGAALAANESPTAAGATPAFNRPQWTVEGESAAFDFENDAGTIETDADKRKVRTGELQLTPYATSSSWLGSTFILGTSKLGSADWYTSRANVSMTARSFRIAIRDDCGGTVRRRSTLKIASIGIEIANTGTTRK